MRFLAFGFVARSVQHVMLRAREKSHAGCRQLWPILAKRVFLPREYMRCGVLSFDNQKSACPQATEMPETLPFFSTAVADNSSVAREYFTLYSIPTHPQPRGAWACFTCDFLVCALFGSEVQYMASAGSSSPRSPNHGQPLPQDDHGPFPKGSGCQLRTMERNWYRSRRGHSGGARARACRKASKLSSVRGMVDKPYNGSHRTWLSRTTKWMNRLAHKHIVLIPGKRYERPCASKGDGSGWNQSF